MGFYEIPRESINCFEKLHHLQVTVHDLTGNLWPFLSPEYFHHRASKCQAVKKTTEGSKCLAFEGESLRRALALLPQGRVHICHAGYVEWVVPVLEDKLQMVLFAGIMQAHEDLQCDVHPASLPILNNASLPSVSQSQSILIHEHLRQLSSRLKQWSNELQTLQQSSCPIDPTDANRQMRIQTFIMQHHTQQVRLRDLAKNLRLSESRTSHVVSETCGQTFRQLLTEARLRTAMGLLRHTNLPLIDLAHRSGFDDLRNFYRLFKRQVKQSPQKYRMLHE